MRAFKAWCMAGVADAQAFQIPAEMFQQMFNQQQGPSGPQWPDGVSSEIEKGFSWLENTEWQGKTTKLVFLPDGEIESDMKECKKEDSCFWAANNDEVIVLTPKTKKGLRFIVDGIGEDPAAKARIDGHDAAELKKLSLVMKELSKSGTQSRLSFAKVKRNTEEDSLVGGDLYGILGLTETAEEGEIKSAYRKLSIKHHPDKGGDPKVFNDIREAYEVLSDKKKRKWYDQGGMLLVHNFEVQLKGTEGQEAQMMAQLDRQVPKNHPQRKMYEQQVKQQIPSPEESLRKITGELTNDEEEVMVPLTLRDVYRGSDNYTYMFPRLQICRGCRAKPDSAECTGCGRCPMTTMMKAKRGPMGMQVPKEVKIESQERCREVLTPVTGIKIPRGAKEGAHLKRAPIGHQTPGRISGKVAFKASVASDPTYNVVGQDLYCVVNITLAEALHGFKKAWQHFDDKQVVVTRGPGQTQPGDLVRLPELGMYDSRGKSRGDMYVVLRVALPGGAPPTGAIAAPPAVESAEVARDADIEIRDGTRVWRRWRDMENMHRQKTISLGGKAEL